MERQRSTRAAFGALLAAVLLAANIVVDAGPANAAAPIITYFTATFNSAVDANLVTLNYKVTNTSSRYIYADSEADPGNVTCVAAAGCTKTVRVTTGGLHRYTLEVYGTTPNTSTRLTASASVSVPGPAAPLLQPATAPKEVRVSALSPTVQTLTWQAPASGEEVWLLAPGSTWKKQTTTSAAIPLSQLPAGRTTYNLRTCVLPTGAAIRICGDSLVVSYLVERDQLTSFRTIVANGASVNLAWTPVTGVNLWNVQVPDLGFSAATYTPNFSFPSATFSTSGTHTVYVDDCVLFTSVSCVNDTQRVTTSAAGVLSYITNPSDCGALDAVTQNEVVAKVGTKAIKAPRPGFVHRVICGGQSVTANDVIFTVDQNSYAVKVPSTLTSGTLSYATNATDCTTPYYVTGQTVVATVGTQVVKAGHSGLVHRVLCEGATADPNRVLFTLDFGDGQVVSSTSGAVPTWNTVTWSNAFTGESWDTGSLPGVGLPLDVTVDASGNPWMLGEFQQSVAQITPTGAIHDTIPMLEKVTTGTTRAPVTPFQLDLGAGPVTSSISAAGERIARVGSTIWFTRGGGGLGAPNDRSQIVRFDPALTDVPTTPYDDRMCVIAVPGDQTHVTGIASDGTNLWIAESLWFDPAGGKIARIALSDLPLLGCDNELDYNDPAAIAAAEAQNAQFVHVYALGLRNPQELIVDSDGVWYTGFVQYFGAELGRLTVDAQDVPTVKDYLLPAPIQAGDFGPYPWQIRSDATSVYVGEYADNELVRFDKATHAMSELTLPMTSGDLNQHSIALGGGKLWFTLPTVASSPNDRGASTFGYVDVASWAAGTPTGTIYTGFDTLGNVDTPTNNAAGRYHAFSGIEVAADGSIVLADYTTHEVYRLTAVP